MVCSRAIDIVRLEPSAKLTSGRLSDGWTTSGPLRGAKLDVRLPFAGATAAVSSTNTVGLSLKCVTFGSTVDGVGSARPRLSPGEAVVGVGVEAGAGPGPELWFELGTEPPADRRNEVEPVRELGRVGARLWLAGWLRAAAAAARKSARFCFEPCLLVATSAARVSAAPSGRSAVVVEAVELTAAA